MCDWASSPPPLPNEVRDRAIDAFHFGGVATTTPRFSGDGDAGIGVDGFPTRMSRRLAKHRLLILKDLGLPQPR